jgi:hypothetical protein
MLLLSPILSCYKPVEQDRVKLKELETKFGSRYEFSLTSDGIYLYAKLKKGATMYRNDDEEIYKIFIFNNFEKEQRRDTSFVYLNLYDSKNNFLHQICYDPQSRKLVREYKREHY